MKPLLLLLALFCTGLAQHAQAQARVVVSTRSPGTIVYYDFASGNSEALVEGNLNEVLAVAIDTVHRKMYWTENPATGPALIQWSELNGSNRSTLPIPNLVSLSDIAVDYTNQKLLWVDHGAQKIMRSNLDCANVETVATVKQPIGLALNCTFNKIYWTENRKAPSIGKVMRMDQDGTHQEEIASYDGTPAKIAFDCIKNKVLWADDMLKQIKISGPGGLDVSTLLQLTGSQYPYGIALDQDAGTVYWADYGFDVVNSLNVNSGIIQDVLTIKNPYGLARYVFTPVGTSEAGNDAFGLQLAPNPAGDYLHVMLNQSAKQANGTLSDATGHLLKTVSLYAGENALELSGLPAGVYLLQVRENDLFSAARFVKM